MELYELTVAVTDCRNAGAIHVRAWIDGDLDAGLGTESELPLVKHGGTLWSATFGLPSKESMAFAYRVGLLMEPGARWSLVIRHRASSQETLLEDSDVMTARKEWLLGTCEGVRGTRAASRGARQAHGPHIRKASDPVTSLRLVGAPAPQSRR